MYDKEEEVNALKFLDDLMNSHEDELGILKTGPYLVRLENVNNQFISKSNENLGKKTVFTWRILEPIFKGQVIYDNKKTGASDFYPNYKVMIVKSLKRIEDIKRALGIVGKLYDCVDLYSKKCIVSVQHFKTDEGDIYPYCNNYIPPTQNNIDSMYEHWSKLGFNVKNDKNLGNDTLNEIKDIDDVEKSDFDDVPF